MQNLQSEVSQLLLEVNRISQNTNFNGQSLLDGSHAGFQARANAFLAVIANTALSTNGGIATANGVNYGFLAATVTANSANFQTTVGGNGRSSAAPVRDGDGTIELQVINTGVSIAVQETFFDSATGKVSRFEHALLGAKRRSTADVR